MGITLKFSQLLLVILMMQLQESFPFGDIGELFNSALKYASWRTPIPKGTKIFETNIFMIRKVLAKFTKLLFHENLEPHSM